MSARLVIGITALVGVAVSKIVSTLISQEMVDKVNAALPRELRFSALGWYLPKTLRLHREDRRLFPGGKLTRSFVLAVAVALVCLSICAGALGLF